MDPATVLMIARAVPKVLQLLKTAVPVIEAIKKVAPEAMPIVRELAGKMFPDLPHGKAVEKAAEVLFRPMSKEDEKRWMDHATGRTDGN